MTTEELRSGLNNLQQAGIGYRPGCTLHPEAAVQPAVMGHDPGEAGEAWRLQHMTIRMENRKEGEERADIFNRLEIRPGETLPAGLRIETPPADEFTGDARAIQPPTLVIDTTRTIGRGFIKGMEASADSKLMVDIEGRGALNVRVEGAPEEAYRNLKEAMDPHQLQLRRPVEVRMRQGEYGDLTGNLEIRNCTEGTGIRSGGTGSCTVENCEEGKAYTLGARGDAKALDCERAYARQDSDRPGNAVVSGGPGSLATKSGRGPGNAQSLTADGSARHSGEGPGQQIERQADGTDRRTTMHPSGRTQTPPVRGAGAPVGGSEPAQDRSSQEVVR